MKKPDSRMTFAIGLLVGAFGMLVLGAQQPPSVKRTVLLRKDLQIPGREVVLGLTELPPGGAEGRHTHSAELVVYMLEGSLSLDYEGRPPATYKAGDVFAVEPGKIHEGKNPGTIPAKALGCFVAEKGKPLTTQVQ
jgi:quercetin dioxygenase-like cupin family protein